MTFGAMNRRQRLAKLTVAVSSVAAMLIALPGCDDPHQADRRVRDTIVQARSRSAPRGRRRRRKPRRRS